MKRIWTYGVPLLALMIVVAGCTSVPEVESSVDGVNQVPIQLATMRKDLVEHTYVAIGEVVPNNQIDLFVTGNGYIESIEVETGESVVADDLIIQLDDNEADRSTYNSTESQLRTVRDDINAQLISAKENKGIQETLFAEGIVTKMELDQISLQVSSLQRQYTNAAVAYTTQLEALDDSLENSVKNRTIYSPISGTVAAVYIKEGQAVSNQMALSIIDDSALYVKTYISSDLKKLLSKGDTVRVKLDGADDNASEGVIYQMNDLPDMGNKLFETLILIDDVEDYIIGDYAEVEFVIERYEAILIPTQSIIRSGSNQYIYTIENDILTKSEVATGRTKDTWIELKEADELVQVVTRGQNQLTETSEYIVVE